MVILGHTSPLNVDAIWIPTRISYVFDLMREIRFAKLGLGVHTQVDTYSLNDVFTVFFNHIAAPPAGRKVC
jgi:hypothetical protein